MSLVSLAEDERMGCRIRMWEARRKAAVKDWLDKTTLEKKRKEAQCPCSVGVWAHTRQHLG